LHHRIEVPAVKGLVPGAVVLDVRRFHRSLPCRGGAMVAARGFRNLSPTFRRLVTTTRTAARATILERPSRSPGSCARALLAGLHPRRKARGLLQRACSSGWLSCHRTINAKRMMMLSV